MNRRRRSGVPVYPYPNASIGWNTPADVPLGVTVIDGGVAKISRYVANFTGSNYISTATALIKSNVTVDVTVVMQDSAINSWEVLIVNIPHPTAGQFAYSRNANSNSLSLDSYGASDSISAVLAERGWMKLRVVTNPDKSYFVYKNDTLVSNGSYASFLPNPTVGPVIQIGRASNGYTGLIAGFKVVSDLGSLEWKLTEASGNAIDSSGNGYTGNAVASRIRALVPLSVLT